MKLEARKTFNFFIKTFSFFPFDCGLYRFRQKMIMA